MLIDHVSTVTHYILIHSEKRRVNCNSYSSITKLMLAGQRLTNEVSVSVNVAIYLENLHCTMIKCMHNIIPLPIQIKYLCVHEIKADC